MLTVLLQVEQITDEGLSCEREVPKAEGFEGILIYDLSCLANLKQKSLPVKKHKLIQMAMAYSESSTIKAIVHASATLPPT
jgi:hypothetical protein